MWAVISPPKKALCMADNFDIDESFTPPTLSQVAGSFTEESLLYNGLLLYDLKKGPWES